MKKLSLLLSLCSLTLLVQAQKLSADSWKISWKKKVIIETTLENESANTRKIKSSDLAKNYILEISYKEGDVKKQKEWKRSFMFFNETDNELLRKDSTGDWKVTATELKKIFGGKKKIKIYTMALPTDPNMAARVRVRRVHLCTLELY